MKFQYRKPTKSKNTNHKLLLRVDKLKHVPTSTNHKLFIIQLQVWILSKRYFKRCSTKFSLKMNIKKKKDLCFQFFLYIAKPYPVIKACSGNGLTKSSQATLVQFFLSINNSRHIENFTYFFIASLFF